MAVPNIFANVTTSIPLSQLDANFATAITLGNTTLLLGNTTTTVGNLTLTGAAVNGTVGATTPAAGAFTTLSASGVTTVQAGNVAAPAITTSGDTNTGIFFPAADTIAFGEGGAEAVRIDSSGNVGIGTSSPSASVRLDVRGGVFQILGTGGHTGQLLTDASGLTLKNVSNGYMLFGTNNTERMRIDSSGNVLIGATTQAAAARSSVQTATDNSRFMGFQSAAGAEIGYIFNNTTATQYSTSSDYRLKDNVAPMIGALAKVAALKPVTYKWKSDGSDGQGFIAHELQEVVPDCITGEKDATWEEEYEVTPAVPAVVDADGVEVTPAVEAVKGTRTVPSYQGVDTSFLVATLVASIQEQQAIIESLTTRIAALESN